MSAAGRCDIGYRHAVMLITVALVASVSAQQRQTRFLYVAVPGIENEVEYSGAPGILVFDIDREHHFVRRIPTWKPLSDGSVESIRGMEADVVVGRLYISTVKRLAAIDLSTEKVVWDKNFDGFCCDRFAVSPDGATIFAPAFGKPRWNVVRASDGQLLGTINIPGWPRQAIYSRDGQLVYLAAWESSVISVVDAKTLKVIREVGPFSNFVCPFTVNGRETLAFANVDGLVGFEAADLRTGLILDRVAVDGFQMEAAPKYECASHGIALASNERELWLADGVDNRLHVFDATTYPPRASTSIELRAQPRWIVFGVDGRYAYPSTGDVIDTATKKIVASLEDETRTPVRSEKMIEIDFAGGRPVGASRQTAVGLVH